MTERKGLDGIVTAERERQLRAVLDDDRERGECFSYLPGVVVSELLDTVEALRGEAEQLRQEARGLASVAGDATAYRLEAEEALERFKQDTQEVCDLLDHFRIPGERLVDRVREVAPPSIMRFAMWGVELEKERDDERTARIKAEAALERVKALVLHDEECQCILYPGHAILDDCNCNRAERIRAAEEGE